MIPGPFYLDFGCLESEVCSFGCRVAGPERSEPRLGANVEILLMLTRDQILNIARLARLSLEEREVSELNGDLNSILEYVEKLSSLDVKALEPMSHVHGAVNVMRADEPEAGMDIDETLRNAPDAHGRYFRVPLVIDQEG